MGHAAGLWHEHQRCDRDNYVRVPGGDLNSNMSRNCYDRHYSTYDFDSVMNYGAPYVYPLSNPKTDYRGNPRNLGRGMELSSGDLSTLRIIYTGNDTKPTNPTNPTTPTPTNVYTGRISQGQALVLPQGSYFNAKNTTVRGELTGPEGTDFDLYLQVWNGSSWINIVSSDGPSTKESLSYEIGSGSLRWVVYASSGSGEYRLAEYR